MGDRGVQGARSWAVLGGGGGVGGGVGGRRSRVEGGAVCGTGCHGDVGSGTGGCQAAWSPVLWDGLTAAGPPKESGQPTRAGTDSGDTTRSARGKQGEKMLGRTSRTGAGKTPGSRLWGPWSSQVRRAQEAP